MPRPGSPVLSSALALLIGAWVACGDNITVIECPLGTVPQGATCVPYGSVPDGAVDAGGKDTQPGTDLPRFPVLDMGQPDPDVPAGDVAGPVDTGPTVEAPIGAPCVKDADCTGGTCLDWPGGYCSVLDCVSGSCPAGSQCVPLKGGNHACLALCAGGCPQPTGQACKGLTGDDHEIVHLCHGVDEDAGSAGSTCQDDVDCLAAAVCLHTMPGGTCAVQGCEAATCNAGTVCVPFGGQPTCLLACTADGDCGGAPGAERRCGTLKSVEGLPVGACISGAEGAAVGEQCLSDYECTSGTCLLLGEGQCSQTSVPCFEASVPGDCQLTEFCLLTGENGVGTCTQPCSLAIVCPGASLCEGQPGGPEGWCRPPCTGLGPDDDCRPETGFSCTFGYPLGEASGQGRYLCMEPRAGSMGSACAAPEVCVGGACDMAEGAEAGLCVGPCADDLYCPFPAACTSDGAFGTCRQACLSVADCEPGGLCTPAGGPQGSVCQ